MIAVYRLDNQGTAVQSLVGMGIFSSSKHPDLQWGPCSLLFNGYKWRFTQVKVVGA
jgi:hypothetical protein